MFIKRNRYLDELNIRDFNVDVGSVNSFETNENGNGVLLIGIYDFLLNEHSLDF